MASFSIAITGGVASGKSEVSGLFESLGIEIVDADVAARDIVATGEPALAEIADRFGKKILLADGNLDRRQLRELIFSDADAKRDLESITHPRIRQKLRQASEAATSVYAIVVIPLLVESGGRAVYPWLNRILIVDAPIAVQLQRLRLRDGIDNALARQMIAAQASRKQRLALADDVVINDAAAIDLRARVEKLDALYRRLAS